MQLGYNRTQLRQHVGSRAFERGAVYERTNAVRTCSVAPEGLIHGEVIGTKRTPYHAELFSHNGVLDSVCTCPVGYACKHVAALGLHALSLSTEAAPNGKNQAPLAAWQQALANATADTTPTKEWYATLQILLRIRHQQGNAESPLMLEIRPSYLDTRTNKMITTHYYGYRPSSIPPDHSTLARQLEAVLDDSPQYRWRNANGWDIVTHEQANAIWDLLLRARALDIPIYYGKTVKTRVPVPIHDAGIVPSLTITDEKKGLSLVPHFELEQSTQTDDTTPTEEQHTSPAPKATLHTTSIHTNEIVPEHMLLVGTPPVFCVAADTPLEQLTNDKKAALSLYPVRATQNAPLLRTRISIPKKDIPTFEREYLHTLTQTHHVHNRSERVVVPQLLTPRLIIRIGPVPNKGTRKKREQTAPAHEIAVRLQIAYPDTEPYEPDARPTQLQQKNGTPLIHNEDAEGHIRATYTDIVGFHEEAFATDESLGGEPQPRTTYRLQGLRAAHFLHNTVAALQNAEHLHVELDHATPTFTYDESDPTVTFALHAQDEATNDSGDSSVAMGNAQDWFNLGVTVEVGGEHVPFVELFSALARNETHFLLASGRFFPLSHPSLDKLRALIEEARSLTDITGEGLSVTRYQVDFWRELTELGIIETQASEWRSAADVLLSVKSLPHVNTPKGLDAELRPYQHEGFRWLAFLYKHRLGGILADDMGLGKTLQTITLILHAKRTLRGAQRSTKPCLIVAPTSVVENWDTELARFAPALSRTILRSGDRSEQHQQIAESDVVVTSYALLRRDHSILSEHTYDMLILDEAHMTKNHQSQSYALVRELNATCRFALTGTPLENSLMDLWALTSIVAPGLLPNTEQFNKQYRKPIEKERDEKTVARLRSRIKPFLLRRNKTLVAAELPAKTTQVVSLAMHAKHERLYELHLQRERQKVLGLIEEGGGTNANRFAIFRSLMLLRRVALHPGLIDTKHAKVPSVKLAALLEHLQAILTDDHKVLVFSQFTSYLQILRTEIEQAGITCAYLDGSTKDRKGAISTFQNGQADVFLISLKAGGVGLNLTQADYCIIMDPWWNPSIEHQAVDRAHRIGQTRAVNVYKFITKNTIEEKVLALQQKKQALIDTMLDSDDAFSSTITEDDIRALFS